MIAKKPLKIRLVRAIFGCFFGILGLILPLFASGKMVSAITAGNGEETTVTTEVNNADGTASAENTEGENKQNEPVETRTCDDSLGSLGWLVCPTTGKISEAVDWLYDKNKELLEINPVKASEDSPIFLVWNYCLGVANIAFVIFLLIMIYSQITGVGISNYGVKKALPKLIIAAIMVNLSFLLCSLAVDVSNIIGGSLRGIFTAVQEQTVPAMLSVEHYTDVETSLSMANMYSSLAGGTALTTGIGVIAFEGGEIWMLIPAVLGALVAVVTGLITIALRQVVVMLLIMIAPLAIVAYIMPNTEGLFRKWKDLLVRMLVFYPMYSLLFGVSSLAGWVIISSATDGFGMILGVAVQIFPLFFSWSLMKMSGTFLGTVNAKITGFFATPLASNRAWAESHRELTKQKYLSSKNVYTPSLRLRQYLNDRKIAREEETREYSELVKNRGLAYSADRNYKRKKKDELNRKGEEAYENQARNLEYQRRILRHKDNMNKGFSDRFKDANSHISRENWTPSMNMQYSRLKELDEANVNASDELKMEMSRGAKIDFDNTKGFFERIANANDAHMDDEALKRNSLKHQYHTGGVFTDSNLARYNTMKNIMEGNKLDTNFILADAAHSYNAQSQIVRGKFGEAFSLAATTQDLINMLNEMTKVKNSNDYIDPIIAGMKVLNIRGDTDEVRKQLERVLADGKVELGTHTSQALANFFMFDVKGSDPFLRRFGKYINLETAKMFNEDDPGERRTRKDVSLYEYVNGEYIDRDGEGNVLYDDDGNPRVRKTKRKAAILMKGTSFKDAERTSIPNMIEGIREQSYDIDENGNRVAFNFEKFVKNQTEIWDAIMPNIIGDQFSYLSGSEQITALGKGITGMDVQKHKLDWDAIFGKEIAATLTTDQKREYLKFLNERTKTFLGGQVPSQIAKTKTDILEAVRNQYAYKDAVEGDDKLLDDMSKSDFKMSKDEYAQFEKQHIDKIKEEFVNSYKEDALKGFVKMHHKGYQGEAKDGLIQLLNPDELYEKYFGNGSKQNNRAQQNQQRRDDDDDDDDGMPVDMGGDINEGPIYSETRSHIEDIYRAYSNGSSADVDGFWEQVKDTMDPSTMFGNEAVIDEIENGLSQYTSVAELYADIINRLFGGFNN